MPRRPSPLVIAHRGVSAHAPENTLAAFQMAIDVGADGVELDVRLSKDGVPIVVHDRNLVRLAGRSDSVANLTAGELSRVDVGSHFNAVRPRRARSEFVGAGVPTLAAVLELFGTWTGKVHVELKRSTGNGSCNRS